MTQISLICDNAFDTLQTTFDHMLYIKIWTCVVIILKHKDHFEQDFI